MSGPSLDLFFQIKSLKNQNFKFLVLNTNFLGNEKTSLTTSVKDFKISCALTIFGLKELTLRKMIFKLQIFTSYFLHDLSQICNVS